VSHGDLIAGPGEPLVVDQRLDDIRTHHVPHDAGTGADEVPSSEVSGVPRIGLAEITPLATCGWYARNGQVLEGPQHGH
jgi:hypothetical protein